jgi:putative peptide zinc metalloprotease protein
MLNEQTFEFGQAKLKAKQSLRFSMRQSGEDAWYMVEDEATGKFFQIGFPQYTFLSLLNGRRTVNAAMMRTASLLRQDAFDEQQVANICKWSIEAGLVETELSGSASRRAAKESQELLQKSVSWLNPITLKVPLFQPDRLVGWATRLLGWLVSPGGAILWTMVVCYGFFQLALHWKVFVDSRISSFSSLDLFWFGAAWLVLKLIHEAAHSIVCKRYGGRVRSCGMLLLLLIPLPYVDVTSSWSFQNKWHRILTSAAGMLAELFIAAIACCVWVDASPGPLQYHAGNLIIAATLHTLLFNANPLMRFDGYYMLSDWLDIPNLSTHGKQYLKSAFKRIYFGNKPKPIIETGWRALVVKSYGFLAMLWFGLIVVGLSLGASSLIEGIGLLILASALVLWLLVPIAKCTKYFLLGSKLEKPNRIWFVTAASLTALLIGGFLFICPSPSVVTAPIVVDYEPLSIIRSEISGFAREVHIKNGQSVKQGDLLVTLENREIANEYTSLLIDIRISNLRINTLLKTEEIGSLKLEEESLQASMKRKAELELLLSKLEIRADRDGDVLALELDALTDTYLNPGSEVLSIGMPGELKAIALARQQDLQWLENQNNDKVELLIFGRNASEIIPGRITKVDPRARDDLPHEAFAASNGGTLAVVPRDQMESDPNSEANTLPDGIRNSMMLTAPRIPIEIELSTQERHSLIAGQTGTMFISNRNETIGRYLVQNFVRFVRENNFRTHGL